MVDRLPDSPEDRCGDKVALHQAAGRFIVERQRALDGRPIGRGDAREDAGATIFLEVVEEEGRVVGVEVTGHRDDGGVGEFIQRLKAHFVGQLRHRLGWQVLAEDVDHFPESVRRQMLQQVGGVGGVEVLDRAAQERLVAIPDGADELGDKGRRNHAGGFDGFLGIGDRNRGLAGIGGVIHRDLPLPAIWALS